MDRGLQLTSFEDIVGRSIRISPAVARCLATGSPGEGVVAFEAKLLGMILGNCLLAGVGYTIRNDRIEFAPGLSLENYVKRVENGGRPPVW